MKYTCPMHSEVVFDKPGKCPKCGMALVKQEEVKNSHTSGSDNSYTPLIVVVGLIISVALALSVRDIFFGPFILANFLQNIMIGFFLTFGGFKLMDLKGFVEGYRTYDLLAMRLPSYGYVYPFLEVGLGLSMVILPHNPQLLIFEILLMGFSGIGVLIKLLKKERFQCACLGTFLKVPLTKVTLVEDFGMVLIGLALLMGI